MLVRDKLEKRLGRAQPPRASRARQFFVHYLHHHVSPLHPQLRLTATTPANPPKMTDLLDSMLDLMRRLPPTNVEENVTSLVSICPEYADDLLGSVDQPLRIMADRATGKEYLACDYNRDGESYR